jgi:capsular polysaccharide export protein
VGNDVVSIAAPITLKKWGNLKLAGELDIVGQAAPSFRLTLLPCAADRQPFLRIPPFPGAKVQSFAEMDAAASAGAADLVEQVRRLRVGGTYWGAQPKLPPGLVVVRSSAASAAAAQLFGSDKIIIWQAAERAAGGGASASVIHGECDPWHVLSSASAVAIDPDDEVRVIAGLLNVDCYVYDAVTERLELSSPDVAKLLGRSLSATVFVNPFTGEPMETREAVELCGFWRSLIDSNRDLAGGLGFAFWKQGHVAPLLWGGSQPFKFVRTADEIAPGARLAVWRAKTSPDVIAALESKKVSLIEVEDGFLRSRGLGADCIPPLSLTVDRLGPYFDPSQASELEKLLQEGRFEEPLLVRARELRQLIVEAGLSKYERGMAVLERPAGARRHILVPGQVEDDRAVQCGGCGLVSNLELLRRVRQQAPDAFIIYKPHPDVVAGHRRGVVPDRLCLEYADQILNDAPIASLIALVDEVHVNTSLAGFEALLRGKPVTTYGVPFYAGWSLTRDLGPVPSRRTARRTIDELVAATLLLYPRYLDPATGLPCPAEIVVARLSTDDVPDTGMIVGMRRLQGKLMRGLRSLVQ